MHKFLEGWGKRIRPEIANERSPYMEGNRIKIKFEKFKH